MFGFFSFAIRPFHPAVRGSVVRARLPVRRALRSLFFSATSALIGSGLPNEVGKICVPNVNLNEVFIHYLHYPIILDLNHPRSL